MATLKSRRPTCFISYSWDSPEHREWVRVLADQLTNNGVITILDQYDLRVAGDVLAFMEDGITKSNFVVLVCTPRFKRKSTRHAGGVGWEGTIVTGQMFLGIGRPGKFVPILREGTQRSAIPNYLATKNYIDFREEADPSEALEQLVRHIYDEPKHIKPETSEELTGKK